MEENLTNKYKLSYAKKKKNSIKTNALQQTSMTL